MNCLELFLQFPIPNFTTCFKFLLLIFGTCPSPKSSPFIALMPPSSPLQARCLHKAICLCLHFCSFYLTVFFASMASYTHIILLIFKFHILENYASDDEGLSKCNCMPACAEITYDVENSHAKFSWLDTVNAFDKIKGSNQTTTAKWVQITDKNSLNVLKNSV